MQINSKLPEVETTIFTIMTNMANEHKAINLSQGFPDFDVDPALISLIEKYMRKGYNQYAPMQGVLALREQISRKVKSLHDASYSPGTEITVTSGATEALFAAITAVVKSGDEVIIFEPAFDSYVPAVRLSGGVPVFIKLDFPDYSINWDRVIDAVTDRTRLIIINSPHNPTGSVLGERDIAALRELVSKHDIFILSDEVYEHIIYDNNPHESMARYPDLARRSFIISSFGKTYSATGWKIGYCLAPQRLSWEFQKVHQFLTFATNTPIQYALAEFMENSRAHLDLSGFYQGKRDLFLSRLSGSRFRAIPSRGTYFQILDYSGISGEPDTEFSKRLTMEHGVASIPPSVFYNDREDRKVLRFCFAKKDDTLKEAAERLCRI